MHELEPHHLRIDQDLLIRPYREQDADELFPRLLAERASGLWWISSIDRLRTREDLVAEFRRVRVQVERGQRLGGAVVWNGRIVGSCRIGGLTPDVSVGDLGYWLLPEARGRGVITRCARTLLDHAFQRPGLERITLGAAPQNHDSRAVAQRLGFIHERTSQGALERGGRRWDAMVFVMSRQTWQVLRQP